MLEAIQELPIWAFLAQLTQMFDWEALAAVFTAWAVWIALSEARRAARVSFNRTLESLKISAAAAAGLREICNHLLTQLAAGLSASECRQNVDAVIFRRVKSDFDSHLMNDLPTSRLWDGHLSLKGEAEDISKARFGASGRSREAMLTHLLKIIYRCDRHIVEASRWARLERTPAIFRPFLERRWRQEREVGEAIEFVVTKPAAEQKSDVQSTPELQ